MDTLAFCFGQKEIYWSTVIRIVGLITAFSLEFFLVQFRGKKREMMLLIPFQLIFGFLIARLIFWDCTLEAYANWQAAVSDFAFHGLCYDGVVIGCMIAVWPVKLLYRKADVRNLYDVSAIAVIFYELIIRLGQYYTGECRSFMTIESEKFQRLPFGVESVSATGVSIFYVATFALDAILIFIVLILALLLFFLPGKTADGYGRKGHTATISIAMLAAVSIVADSSRNDASHFRFNGFVSQTEIFYLLFLLGLIIFYSIRSVRNSGLSYVHFMIWVGLILAIGNAGAIEYYKQRLSDMSIYWFPVMFVSLVTTVLLIFNLYMFSGRKKAA